MGFKARVWKRLQRETESNNRDGDREDSAISECVYGCTSPFNEQTRLSPRLLCVRDARYKLILRLEPGAVEDVYDLVSDPMERRPLKGHESAEIRLRLLNLAYEYIKTGSAYRSAARLKILLRDLQLKLLA